MKHVWKRPGLLQTVVLGTLVIMLGSCASFQGDIPVDVDYARDIYISPRNQDGIQDDVVLPLDIPEIRGLRLAGYEVQVVSQAGREVYSYGEQHFKQTGLRGLFRRPPAVEPPDTIRWDGTDYAGAWVDDGVYLLSVSAWDYRDNRGSSPVVRVNVDNTPPTATVVAPFLVFAPTGDGNQDTLELSHENASTEDLWNAEITDTDGTRMVSYQWRGVPGTVQWDGTRSDGSPAPDGRYRYVLRSTDRAGNSFVTTLEDIVLDRRSFPVNLTVSPLAFSPNDDGVQDSVRFVLRADAPDQIADIALAVKDARGTEMRRYGPDALATGVVQFDGRDNAGRRLPEGWYTGELRVVYRNGYNPVVSSERFQLDVTPPQATVRANWTVFSPDGDGRRDTVTIAQNSRETLQWRGVITDQGGRTVREYHWDGRLASVNWDGRDSAGELVPDGVYRYTLSATDAAGNSASFPVPRIVVDTRPTPVRVTPRRRSFNPSAGAEHNVVEFDLTATVTDGVSRWGFAVIDEIGNEVMRHQPADRNIVAETVVWDGTTPEGDAAEGIYFGKLEVEYEKGNLAAEVTETPVRLDRSPPTIQVSLGRLPFQPVDDELRNTLRIAVSVDDPSGVREWWAEILDPMGNRFRRIPSRSFRNGVFQWDGTSETGEWVQSASDYTLVVHAEDNVGNRGSAEFRVPIDILVMRVGDRLQIVISSIYFKPFTADFTDVPAETRRTNLATLDRLAEILTRYRGHTIELEGHAVRLLWNRPTAVWENEEHQTLLPLSTARAEAIRNALVQRGIPAARMTTIGKGGYAPVVPHGDQQNRWKNRRVEFFLSQ
ncbi:MAG: hypothetical protein EA384_12610 [Spirochaetaceae bacterium]|nr:MAG: hypothetical protein EA384_12610 [Spirochaetaceae bacterium]